MNDEIDRTEEILSGVPDYVQLPGLFKARASEESGKRFLYFEASNEDVDHSNEIVLQKALKDSSEYYLRHGNVDLSHYSLLGPRSGMKNFMEYEIGRPVDVHVGDKRTFVKAELYQGDSAMARNAGMVWDSMTKQSPPSRWYPSVGGKVLAKSVRIDPDTGDKVGVVDSVLWNNTALDRCPVNKTVPEASAVPFGVFAKSMNGFVISKTLEAGYGTDSATLTGGGALRLQSLHGSDYADLRDSIAAAIMQNRMPSGITHPALIEIAQSDFGLSLEEANELVHRFLNDCDLLRRH